MSKIPKELSPEVTSFYSIDNDKNTFSKRNINEHSDIFDIKIGDIKQPDFKPRFKLERWNNKANFSVGLIENGEIPEIKIGGNKIKWIESKRETHFYPLTILSVYCIVQ